MVKNSKVDNKSSASPAVEEVKLKEIPINKYSIYEIKSAIDSKIIEVNI
jgi:hypothetical protein